MIFATNNKGKLKELRSILNEYEIYSLKDKNIEIEIEENMETFKENAILKAKTIYKITNEPVIADDSGLCIEALNDFPGVRTARFLGDDATDEDKNNKLLEMTKELNNKSAKVICILAYYDGEREIIGEGVIKGNISKEKRGKSGFGFDEIFELDNKKTLAELTDEEKNKVSARKLAAKDIKNKLKQSI